MFCEAAVTYAKGVLPHTDGGLSPQQQVEFKEANILKKVQHNLCVCVLCCVVCVLTSVRGRVTPKVVHLCLYIVGNVCTF